MAKPKKRNLMLRVESELCARLEQERIRQQRRSINETAVILLLEILKLREQANA